MGTRGSLVCLATLLVGSLEGQVSGTVVGSDDSPVEAAVVEVWADTARLGHSFTDSSGRFTIEIPPGRYRVQVRAVGFAPTNRDVATWPVRVTMAPSTISLAPIAARREDVACGDDSHGAREAWEKAAINYLQTPSRMATNGRSFGGHFPQLILAAIREDLFTPWHAESNMRDSWLRHFREGRFFLPYTGLTTDRNERWQFPRLEADVANVFVHGDFGRSVHFTSADSTQSAVDISFCADGDPTPFHGQISVANNRLLRAQWSFITPDAIAGGQALFSPHGSLALPTSSFFYRKRLGDYYQRWFEFDIWYSCSTTSCGVPTTETSTGP